MVEIPLDLLLKHLPPEGRAHSKIQAMAHLYADHAAGILRSQRAYGRIWRRSRAFVRSRFDELKPYQSEDNENAANTRELGHSGPVTRATNRTTLVLDAMPPKRRRKPKTDAPDGLGEGELARLQIWTRDHQRDDIRALVAEVEDMAEACLTWHRRHGTQGVNWMAACQQWIRKENRSRKRGRSTPMSNIDRNIADIKEQFGGQSDDQ